MGNPLEIIKKGLAVGGKTALATTINPALGVVEAVKGIRTESQEGKKFKIKKPKADSQFNVSDNVADNIKKEQKRRANLPVDI